MCPTRHIWCILSTNWHPPPINRVPQKKNTKHTLGIFRTWVRKYFILYSMLIVVLSLPSQISKRYFWNINVVMWMIPVCFCWSFLSIIKVMFSAPSFVWVGCWVEWCHFIPKTRVWCRKKKSLIYVNYYLSYINCKRCIILESPKHFVIHLCKILIHY